MNYFGTDTDWPKINLQNQKKKLQEDSDKAYEEAKKKGYEAGINKAAYDKVVHDIRLGMIKEIKELEEKIENLKLEKSVLEDFIDIYCEGNTFSKAPHNERETEVLFLDYANYLGFRRLISNNGRFPDYFAIFGGKKCSIELECLSSDFIEHTHDPSGANYIVCWRHNTKQEDRLPKNIIELKSALAHFYKP